MRSTRKTSSDFRMGFAPDAASTMRWTPWRSESIAEGELGAGRRHPGVLRRRRPRVADQLRRAPDRRPAGDPPDPQVAEGRGDGGRAGDADRDGNAARRGDLAPAGEHLPALRLRSVGRNNGENATPMGKSSSCATPTTSSSASSTRPTPSGSWADLKERVARFALALHPDKDAPHRVWPLRGGQPRAARAGQAGDLQLPGVHAHLRTHPTRAISCFGGNRDGTGCGQKCTRSRRNSGDAGTRRSPNRVDGCDVWLPAGINYHAVPTNIAALSTFQHHVATVAARASAAKPEDRTTWEKMRGSSTAGCPRHASSTPGLDHASPSNIQGGSRMP